MRPEQNDLVFGAVDLLYSISGHLCKVQFLNGLQRQVTELRG